MEMTTEFPITFNNHHCYTKECAEKYAVWTGINVATNIHIFYAICLWYFFNNQKRFHGKCLHWNALYLHVFISMVTSLILVYFSSLSLNYLTATSMSITWLILSLLHLVLVKVCQRWNCSFHQNLETFPRTLEL
eukprot:TCONS_00048626-protein